MLKTKGEGFVKKLQSQEIRLFTLGSVPLLDQIAAGEIGASPVIFQPTLLNSWKRARP